MRVEALPANTSILTCLANDKGYESIFSQQLKVKANQNDVLIVLSGSGNSQNVVKALEVGNDIGMRTFAILGYSGGKCKTLAQYPIHFEIDDKGCLVIHAPMLNPESIVTNDIVELVDKSSFRWLGRFDNVINSGGIKIIPEVVEAKLATVILNRRFFIAGVADESLGEKVILVVEGESVNITLESLEKYEKAKDIYFIPEFVETKSGKIHRQTTLSLI